MNTFKVKKGYIEGIQRLIIEGFVPNQWMDIIRSSAVARPFRMQDMLQGDMMELSFFRILYLFLSVSE
jgi:hypothetical protein